MTSLVRLFRVGILVMHVDRSRLNGEAAAHAYAAVDVRFIETGEYLWVGYPRF